MYIIIRARRRTRRFVRAHRRQIIVRSLHRKNETKCILPSKPVRSMRDENKKKKNNTL